MSLKLGFLGLSALFLFGPGLPGLSGTSSVQAAEKTYTNSIGMEFVLIPAGSFQMGADKNLEDTDDDETPQHRVTSASRSISAKPR